MFAIEAKGIMKSFFSSGITINAVKPLDLTIEAGRMTLIVGPSGCGKSTLIAMLSGLLRPDGGSIRLTGKEITTMDSDELDGLRLAEIGFIFQGFNLFPALSAAEQVALPLHYRGLRKSEALSVALEALGDVGLSQRAHLRPLELSGGEKQRVAIARAMAKRPRVLFADEPTSALDKENGEKIAAMLKDSAARRGVAIVCVTHDQRILRHADRVIDMDDGIVVSDREIAP